MKQGRAFVCSSQDTPTPQARPCCRGDHGRSSQNTHAEHQTTDSASPTLLHSGTHPSTKLPLPTFVPTIVHKRMSSNNLTDD